MAAPVAKDKDAIKSPTHPTTAKTTAESTGRVCAPVTSPPSASER